MVEDADAVKEDAVEDAVEDAATKGDAVEDADAALVMLMASTVAALAATALDIEVVFVLNESIAVGDVELLRDVLPFRALKIDEKKSLFDTQRQAPEVCGWLCNQSYWVSGI